MTGVRPWLALYSRPLAAKFRPDQDRKNEELSYQTSLRGEIELKSHLDEIWLLHFKVEGFRFQAIFNMIINFNQVNFRRDFGKAKRFGEDSANFSK